MSLEACRDCSYQNYCSALGLADEKLSVLMEVLHHTSSAKVIAKAIECDEPEAGSVSE